MCAVPFAWGAPTDFRVESPADGRVFRLSEARGRFVVLHFLLRTECPFCLQHTQEFAKKAERLPGVVQVFLKPDGEDEIRRWATRLGKAGIPAVPIYRDPGAGLAKAYGIPDGYRFHGEVVHYPALVLLGPDGNEVFRHVGKENSDRMRFEEFEKRLSELKPKVLPEPGRTTPSGAL